MPVGWLLHKYSLSRALCGRSVWAPLFFRRSEGEAAKIEEAHYCIVRFDRIPKSLRGDSRNGRRGLRSNGRAPPLSQGPMVTHQTFSRRLSAPTPYPVLFYYSFISPTPPTPHPTCPPSLPTATISLFIDKISMCALPLSFFISSPRSFFFNCASSKSSAYSRENY
jgi:hypothetical protein